MVFAVWAARPGVGAASVAEAFRDSCRFGRERIEQIVASEAPRREFPPALVREYLTRHIVHELELPDYEGMELFLRYARKLAAAGAPEAPTNAI